MRFVATTTSDQLAALTEDRNREAVRQFLSRRYGGAVEVTEEMIDALAEAAAEELERRDYDASDPASPQNTATDARDSSVTP